MNNSRKSLCILMILFSFFSCKKKSTDNDIEVAPVIPAPAFDINSIKDTYEDLA